MRLSFILNIDMLIECTVIISLTISLAKLVGEDLGLFTPCVIWKKKTNCSARNLSKLSSRVCPQRDNYTGLGNNPNQDAKSVIFQMESREQREQKDYKLVSDEKPAFRKK
jgi:hypothetical protein